MLVETFECEETKTEEPELSAEAMRLIEELDLDGQRGLNEPKTDTRMPYRKMDAEEAFVYGQLCPTKTPLKKYKEGPIPLRVLQVASHAKGIFDELIVWHKASPAVKDPVLVGMKKNPSRSWEDGEAFILARWGDVLDEWPALTKAALGVFRAKTRDGLTKLKSEVDATLARIDDVGIDGAMKFQPPYFT
jgi:hypothetical protein